jgi:nicotinamide-nucleotide adenylyltransferase
VTWEAALQRARSAGAPTLEVVPPIDRPESVALLSGSFDPPTVGHLALARAALARADRLVFVYSVRTLQKEGPGHLQPLLPPARRLWALDALAGIDDRFSVGVASHGLLLDQVVAARARWPRGRLVVVIGSDKVVQLVDPKWYVDRDVALGRLVEEAEILYALRTGDGERLEAALASVGHWRKRFVRLEVEPAVAAVSSRMVRELVRAGRPAAHLVPGPVRPLLGL